MPEPKRTSVPIKTIASITGVLACAIALVFVVLAAAPNPAGKGSTPSDPDTPSLVGEIADEVNAVDESTADVPEEEYCEPGSVLVRLSDGATAEDALAALTQLPELEDLSIQDAFDSYVKFSLPEGLGVQEAISLIATTDAPVASAQPEYVYTLFEDTPSLLPASLTADSLTAQATTSPNDPYYSLQWGLGSIKATKGWSAVSGKSGSPIVVAVMDGGFRRSHKDLENVVTATSYNAYGDYTYTSNDSSSIASHGTHVAGTVGAQTNNGWSVAGVAYNTSSFATCKILPVRVSNSYGTLTSSGLLRGYSYIMNEKRKGQNIRVVNLSLGTLYTSDRSDYDHELRDAVANAWDNGIITVAAAGNVTDNYPTPPYYAYPSDFDNVVSVINLKQVSSGQGVAVSESSNYNVSGKMAKDISAPGTDIWSNSSNSNTGSESKSGTSMASPAVAGVLALELRANPSLTPSEATSKLFSSALDLAIPTGTYVGYDPKSGYGEVDAENAVSTEQPYLSSTGTIVRAGSTLKFTVKLNNATQSSGWTWSSSDTEIATVDSSGNVKGVAAGQVTIKASKSGYRNAVQTVTVIPNSTPKAISTLSVSVPDQTYTGSAIKPNPVVYDGTKRLSLYTDYTIGGYSRNTNVGYASVQIIGRGNYSGYYTKYFRIKQASIANASVTVSPTSYTYNGGSKTPSVAVRYNGRVLRSGTDYTLTYPSNRKSIGKKTITVVGKGNFTGAKYVYYYINAASSKSTSSSSVKRITMLRLYNPYTSEHLYTSDVSEKNVLTAKHGWKYEGLAWTAPSYSSTPVYRLYNRTSGDHHYTTDARERDVLARYHGWTYEGVGWYSAAKSGKPLYRLYNPGLRIGAHHYTTDASERNVLTARHGWKYEGVGWYGL